MAVVYTKDADGKIVATETKAIEQKFDIKDLKRKKQFLQDKLAEIQLLIDEAKKLNVE
jgi:hypothetical protein